MFSERLKRLTPYVPGEQPQDKKYLKLNTNENPYPPAPRIKAFLESLDPGILRLYPDPSSTTLRETIAKKYGLTKEEVFVSNGSDEALSFCFYAFFDSARGKLLFPEFTYSFYPVYCDFYGIEYERVPLDDDYVVEIEGFINRERSCGLIFANPNAPTGTCLPLDRLVSLLDRYPKDRVVLIDEAYVDFGGESAVGLIREHRNLLIVRTLSKSLSLAGLRLGFVLAQEHLIQALVTVKDSFNSYPCDRLSQMIAELALLDEAYYRSITERIMETRDRFSAEMRKIGWNVLPSKANFVFAKKDGVQGKEVYRMLKDKGILVRHFNVKGISDFVRITMGTEEEMKRLLEEIKKAF
ncbi:MAG: histidinol-phosphate transaminase [Pseudomonadota bacterium]